MIASLRGTLATKYLSWAIIEVGGVGYKVSIPLPELQQMREGKEYSLLIHYHQREDDTSLYGFTTEEQKELFESLISVSGIGPKVAMNILSTADAKRLASALADGEAGYLESLPGVGKKTAARLAVELAGKLSESESSSGIIDALTTLGYSRAEAAKAAKVVDSGASEEEQLKQALGALQR